ncbi:two-component sensor histidine kinase [Nakamurella flavida]|uniref:Sensor-like histidine kinase SenX3 n=1 Tax=Nakamurella flavida TaxID=363630 RepID=A0A938YNH0_9ACTN|nr:two-component sensor histidine kinase [Nakamurella flavida]
MLAALGGALIGWLVCAVVLSRRATRSDEVGAAPLSLADEVLARSETGYLILDADGLVVLSNGRADELGVVRHGEALPAVVSGASRATISGEVVDLSLGVLQSARVVGVARAPSRTVHAVARSLGGGMVMVSAFDDSEAQRLEAVRRDFFANVSHELKTPVGAIALLSEAVLDAVDDPDTVRRFAGQMNREARRLAALVTELITLSRLQSTEPIPEPTVVEVDQVVEETLNRTATSAEQADITVATDHPSGLLVRGDRALLVTALTNLVENAIHYSPAGTPVSVTRTVRGGHVQIAVTDRGPGIAQDLHERVFERFFRIDPARSRATGGTGLGLSIVKHIAANHGGAATLWSRPGTGSTFTLVLPAVDGPPSPTEHRPPAGELVPATESRAGSTPAVPAENRGVSS